MKIYDAIAMPFGSWGSWVVLDDVWNGSDKPVPLAINAWQVDKIKAPFDGQLYWFQDKGDREAHLTTFIGGFIEVKLAASGIQEPKVRFTNHGLLPMLIRFTVGSLITLPSFDGKPPGRPLRDEMIPAGKELAAMEAWMMARSRSIRG